MTGTSRFAKPRLFAIWSFTEKKLPVPAAEYRKLPYPNFQPTKSLGIINACFKPVRFGVVCYAALSNWYRVRVISLRHFLGLFVSKLHITSFNSTGFF